MNITSAAGVISLLEEPMPEVRRFALEKLDTIVDEFWPEISESITKIEDLHEAPSETSESQELAALVASKVYYNMGDLNSSLKFALGAGSRFDVNGRSEYVKTLVSKCMDRYAEVRVTNAENRADVPVDVDPRLEDIIHRMFQRCLEIGQYRESLGLALEVRRMDMFELSIAASDDVKEMLSYAFAVAMSSLENRGFRSVVLRSLVSLYRNLKTPDYVNMCQCLILLDEPSAVAKVLEELSRRSEDNTLMAYQLAFDMYESATQQFLKRVMQALNVNVPPVPQPADVPQREHVFVQAPTQSSVPFLVVATAANAVAFDMPVQDLNYSSSDRNVFQSRVENLGKILSGEITIGLHLQFLIRSNHTDMQILKNTKAALRESVCHTATVIANGFMHSGTTSDQFLRDNLDWLASATNWSKMAATASLGVIHRGHEHDALALMRNYAPHEDGPNAGYSEGGALYALGLIHANRGAAVTDYLLRQLKDAQNEAVRHGGCLGLGLAAMGTRKQDVYEQLMFNLNQDEAVVGEAAGIAMGAVMLGSDDQEVIRQMVAYAQETQHEKILRGLSVGIALIAYGRLEEADPLITSLMLNKDPVVRRSGMYALAMAYCGTRSNQAIRKLLHSAVSDTDDDVRRAAVIGLGFLLFRSPEQCTSVVSLLAESYNPHVRYGAAMALGIACAGTGLKRAVAILHPMTEDPVNFVRQGALIASAMILIQHTELTCPKVKDFRKIYAKVIADKYEDVMAKFGAILAQGIIDAGGRNVTITLESRTGHTNALAVVGMLLATQYWYWFPLVHCLALAFSPTCLIALNSQLMMPKIEIISKSNPSLFAYTPPLKAEKRSEERGKVTPVELSVAARARRKGSAKDSNATSDIMEVDEIKEDRNERMESAENSKEKEHTLEQTFEISSASDASSDIIEVYEIKGSDKERTVSAGKNKEEKETKPKLPFEIYHNPARIMKAQLKTVSLVENSPYEPLKDIRIGGIIMMRHTDPKHEEQFVEPVAASVPESDEELEPEPPEPFDYFDD